MLTSFYTFLENYFDYFLQIAVNEHFKLVDTYNLDLYKLTYIHNDHIYSDLGAFDLDSQNLQEWLLVNLLKISIFNKFFLVFNTFLVKLIFLKITPVTFWIIPIFSLFIIAIVLLFLIKPQETNLRVWVIAKVTLIFIILYQFFLLWFYISMYHHGIILKVGVAGAFNLPFNLSLAKLICMLLIFVGLFLTILIYLDYYGKNILLIKPELCSILIFLGFGGGMVFLQNDLFSIFLYFEVISFCIYGLLFIQKRTNAQLHSLVWYVLLSLWVSTCYIIGTAFYISAKNTSTNLVDFKNLSFNTFNYQKFSNFSLDSLLLQDFEFVFAITFIMIYFLFKLGAGPFYTWTIEVYNACTTSALFIVSLLPKLVYFPILFFLLFFNFIEYYLYWSNVLVAMGLITVFTGAFGILITDKLKEIYAWSSIIHTGNLLIMLSCISTVTLTFLMFYLISYYLISFGFILLITSLRNWITGWFIKTVGELGSLSLTYSNFYFLAIILLASAAGFTPFLSFFMKFSLLTLISTHYGVFLTIIVGLLNIIGSVAYLRMLWNIIGFNFELFNYRFREQLPTFLDVKMSYRTAWLFNVLIVLIIFSFFFYNDFISFFAYYSNPLFIDETGHTLYVTIIH